MKKLLLSVFLASAFASNAQVTVFEDSFETYEDFSLVFGDWQTLDLDLLNTYTGGLPDGVEPWTNAGDPQAYMIFNPTAAQVTNETDINTGEVRDFDPHTGLKYAAAWAGVPGSNGQTATANNDILVSPVINLGTSNNELTFWVKSMSDSYGLETYRVYIYEGTGTPTSLADFTLISGISQLTAPFPNWELKTFSLDAYANEPIRVGIRTTSADHYMFMVDDFKVTSSNLAVNEAFSAKFSAYPNPSNGIVNVTNSASINVNSIQITDLNGRVVKNVTVSGADQIQVNISELTSGMYMMNINSDAGTAVKKIVKN